MKSTKTDHDFTFCQGLLWYILKQATIFRLSRVSHSIPLEWQNKTWLVNQTLFDSPDFTKAFFLLRIPGPTAINLTSIYWVVMGTEIQSPKSWTKNQFTSLFHCPWLQSAILKICAVCYLGVGMYRLILETILMKGHKAGKNCHLTYYTC